MSMLASAPKAGGSCTARRVRTGFCFFQKMPIVVRSCSALPEGWKWVCRTRSAPLGSGRPSSSGRCLAVAPTAEPEAHVAEARLAVAPVEAARFARVVVGEEDVVDDLAGGGADLDRRDPAVLGRAERDHEVAVDVGAAGGDVEGVLHRDDEVGG